MLFLCGFFKRHTKQWLRKDAAVSLTQNAAASAKSSEIVRSPTNWERSALPVINKRDRWTKKISNWAQGPILRRHLR